MIANTYNSSIILKDSKLASNVHLTDGIVYSPFFLFCAFLICSSLGLCVSCAIVSVSSSDDSGFGNVQNWERTLPAE